LNVDKFVLTVTIYALPVLLAITLHEAAHGYAALRFGDDTAKRMGRLSMNPLVHIDPVGTVLIPALALFFGNFLFGWAKPVPVNFGNLRNPKRDMLWVAAAGPASNFGMAVGWAVLLKLSGALGDNSAGQLLSAMAQAGVQINVSLMILNLLPLPPLDGGRILVSLLPTPQALVVARIEPYGFFILLALAYTGILGKIMYPFVSMTYTFLDLIL